LQLFKPNKLSWRPIECHTILIYYFWKLCFVRFCLVLYVLNDIHLWAVKSSFFKPSFCARSTPVMQEFASIEKTLLRRFPSTYDNYGRHFDHRTNFILREKYDCITFSIRKRIKASVWYYSIQWYWLWIFRLLFKFNFNDDWIFGSDANEKVLSCQGSILVPSSSGINNL